MFIRPTTAREGVYYFIVVAYRANTWIVMQKLCLVVFFSSEEVTPCEEVW